MQSSLSADFDILTLGRPKEGLFTEQRTMNGAPVGVIHNLLASEIFKMLRHFLGAALWGLAFCVSEPIFVSSDIGTDVKWSPLCLSIIYADNKLSNQREGGYCKYLIKFMSCSLVENRDVHPTVA